MFRLTALHDPGAPLPGQGEGEDEGSPKAKTSRKFANPSPQSSPLLQGERREKSRRRWSVSRTERGGKYRFHLTKNAPAGELCIAALLIAAGQAVLAANVLPIYIEDNHAGTFYWLAQNIDLDQACTLILFDAHSDASGI